jgi:hypothetical protein
MKLLGLPRSQKIKPMDSAKFRQYLSQMKGVFAVKNVRLPSERRKLRPLEEESNKLNGLVTNLRLYQAMLQKFLAKKLCSPCNKCSCTVTVLFRLDLGARASKIITNGFSMLQVGGFGTVL